jgi:hypothetical protein
MPFNPAGQYMGGAYIMQGLSNLGQGIGNALSNYMQIQNQAAQADATMQFLSQQTGADGKPVLDPKAYQNYLHYSAAQRAYAAGGMESGIKLAQALQASGWENRLKAAQTNYYTDRGSFEPTTTTVTNPVTGAQVPVLRTSKGQAEIMPGSSSLAGQSVTDAQGNVIGTYDANGRVIRAQAPNPLLALFPNLGTPVQTQGAAPAGAAPTAPPAMIARPADMPPDQAQGAPAAAPPGPGAGGAPPVGTRRTINGQLAEWDGTGWRPVRG